MSDREDAAVFDSKELLDIRKLLQHASLRQGDPAQSIGHQRRTRIAGHEQLVRREHTAPLIVSVLRQNLRELRTGLMAVRGHDASRGSGAPQGPTRVRIDSKDFVAQGEEEFIWHADE